MSQTEGPSLQIRRSRFNLAKMSKRANCLKVLNGYTLLNRQTGSCPFTTPQHQRVSLSEKGSVQGGGRFVLVFEGWGIWK